ncbi:MAG: cysteine desulfurase [Chlamydiales bacterium]|nr:cysteine desulfurase [Chlamydiia bacterium]MCP5508436.1 cysteine desulfurase [Chlamydiales bacterium]
MVKIYLDNNATTPLAPEVIALLNETMPTVFGNPSSTHHQGQEARALITDARDIIAHYFDVRPREVVFTSGATEALNMVIQGIFSGNFVGHVISSSVEHSAVYRTLKYLEEKGLEVTFLEPGTYGAVTPEQVAEAIRPNTRLIALMAVNNETGVKTDITTIAALAECEKIPFLVDAVAQVAKEPMTMLPGISALVFTGHKIHATKGVGVVIIRSSLNLEPLIHGGPHEHGRRAGTEDLLGIIGIGKAVELIDEASHEAVANLRDYFENALIDQLGDVKINGDGPRICNTSNLAFEGASGESLLAMLDMDGVAASHGSACQSGALKPSRVLLNMGYSKERAANSLRFSLSRYTTQKEVDLAVDIIVKAVRRLRAIAKR